MQAYHHSRTFAGVILIVVSLIAFYLGYLVLQGIFIPLLFASLFAVVFHPVYLFLVDRLKNRYLSSAICCLLLVLFFAGIFSLAIYLAVGEVVSFTKVFTESLDLGNLSFLTDQEQLQQLIDQTTARINALASTIPFFDASAPSQALTELLKSIPELLQNISSSLISLLRIGVDSAARILIAVFIFFISFFFLLIDGNSFVRYTFKLLPINALHERQMIKRFTGLCFSWIVVSILLAIIQGSLAGVGFAIIGVPSALIWGVISVMAAFIPFIGVSLIWGVIAIIYLLLGEYWSALFIALWGMLLVGTIDNFLRPFLLRGGIKIHPLILFLAVLGGFFAFGIPGLIIGPIIMVFISTLLYIYELE
ncbi:MAG: AI-2E family transporter, partial [bacterium]|nr:AI-2E family transporter [bacterium]